MTAHDHDLIPDGKMPLSEAPLHDDDKDPSADPSPPYTESAIPPTSPSIRPPGPLRLHILGATWGGINVMSDIQGLVEPDPKTSEFERLKLNMHTIHTNLLPDPAIGVIKTLNILYHYENDELRLLNATQFAPQIMVKVTPTAHLDQEKGMAALYPKFFATLSGTPWRSAPGNGRIEILAVLYGTGRIQTPSVLEELGAFFEGKRGQIRTTTGFFRTDPWPGMRKSWTVYFRVGGAGAVKCVTGMEDGALEVPWWQ